MRNPTKMLSTALAAIMLISAVSVSTPASAWGRYGGGGWGRHMGYGGGWGRSAWGYGGGWGRGGWGRGGWGYGGAGLGLGLGAGLLGGLALGAGARMAAMAIMARPIPVTMARQAAALTDRRRRIRPILPPSPTGTAAGAIAAARVRVRPTPERLPGMGRACNWSARLHAQLLIKARKASRRRHVRRGRYGPYIDPASEGRDGA